jgi:hypothetical protein
MNARILALSTCALLAIFGWTASFGLSSSEPADTAAAGNRPVIEINLIDFDPASGDVHARLHLRLPSSMISKEAAPAHDLVFVDATNVDESILKLSSRDPFSYYDGFINSRYQVNDPGSQLMYPFDEHVTYLHAFVAEDEGHRLVRLPVIYDCSDCEIDGFHVTIADAGTTPTDVRLRLTIRRTTPIIVFSVFLGIAMWAMTLLVIVLALRVIRLAKKKAPEVATMGFIGGLLFAFPAIREAQPRVPPVGVFSDYFAFFWCEFLLMFTLVGVMIAWVRSQQEDVAASSAGETTEIYTLDPAASR